MAASIRSIRNSDSATQKIGVSRDDLQNGDLVTVSSVDTATTYAWNIVYKPEGSTAAFSGDPTQQSPGSFTVDKEGPYLVRLIVDLGLPTEQTQFVRLRYLTKLGDLRLVAAGEQADSVVPVPVDIETDGWANDQNFNLLTLLGFVGTVASSGRIYYVDANAGTEGHGDFDTIQAAIDAAVAAGAASSTPWVVVVRPGSYTENVTFKPYVHVIGLPGNAEGTEEQRAVLVRGTHTATTSAAADFTVVSNLTLENVNVSTSATLQKTGAGNLIVHRCSLLQNAVSATQGPAFLLSAGVTTLSASTFLMSTSAPDDRPAVRQQGPSTVLTMRNCHVRGPSGVSLNAALQTGVVADIADCRITSTGGASSAGIVTSARSLEIEYTRVQVASGIPLTVHPSGSAFAGDVSVTVRWSFLEGLIQFQTAGLTGTTTLQVGSSEYTGFTFPTATPTNLVATTKATSLFYDNSTTGISSETVQAALDEIYTYASQVRTLDDAYDAGTASTGGGRTIYADQGAVRIADSDPPSSPIPAGNTNGRIQVVSNVEVGAFGSPEIDLDPNPFGNGPTLVLGNTIWANNTSFGSTALLMARATENPLYRNYNLRLQTQSATAGSQVGRLILKGGDGLPNGANTPHGGPVYIQGGDGLAGTANPGDIYLSPGHGASGTGSIYVVRPSASTAATLTAAGAAADPIGVSGSVRFATDMGAVEATFDAADSRATVVSKLDALAGVSATESAGVITLTTDTKGPNAEVFFLDADAGVDAALGTFDGQAQVDGTFAESIDIRVTADQEIAFGVSGAIGPMIYNADTGKLTVPGLIDPTGMIFVQATQPAVDPNEGALFVSDGSGGLTAGDLYYVSPGGASSGTPVNIALGGGGGGSLPTTTKGDLIAHNGSINVRVPVGADGLVLTADSTQTAGVAWAAGGGGGGDLATTLGLGNTTGGTDIVVSDGDAITAAAAGSGVPGKNLVLEPGSIVDTDPGALVWGSAYSTTTRGKLAVDLGAGRTAATQIASGDYASIGGGRRNTANALGAHVGGGSDNVASGSNSFTAGAYNEASGNYAVALGANSRATKLYSVAIGQSTLSDAYYAVAMGSNTKAYGTASVSLGSANLNYGNVGAFATGSANRIAMPTANRSTTAWWASQAWEGYGSLGSTSYSFAIASTAENSSNYAHGRNVHVGGHKSIAVVANQLSRGAGWPGSTYEDYVQGSCQYADYPFMAGTTDATPTVAFTLSHNTSGSTRKEYLKVRQRVAYGFRILISATQIKGTAGTIGDCAYWEINGLCRRSQYTQSRSSFTVVDYTLLSPGDTVSVGGVTLTAVANGSTPGVGEFEIGTTNATTASNLVTALNDTANGIRLVHIDNAYASSNVVNMIAYALGTAGDGVSAASSNTSAITTAGAFSGGGDSAITLVGSSASTASAPDYADSGATGWRARVLVDATRQSLDLEVTGELNKAITWSVKFETVEAGGRPNN